MNGTLGIVSPSAPITYAKEKVWREERLNQSIANLRSRGIETKQGDHIFECYGFEAGTNEQRLADLKKFYRDSEITDIIATRGGRSATSLLRSLNYEEILQSGKRVIGFSDVTALLNSIYAKTGIPQIHGPMVTAGLEGDDALTWQSFLAALNEESQSFPLSDFGEWWREGEAEGTLLGGNLVTLECLLGTEFEPVWDNCILFWEEIGESISKIVRIFYHLENAGILSKLNGMIVGRLAGVDGVNPEEQSRAESPRDTLLEVLSGYDFPILKTDLFGHGVTSQLSLPVGGRAVLSSESVGFSVS